jgi:ribosomal protein L23
MSTLNVRGKLRRRRTDQAGQSRSLKKAIVTLRKGDQMF